MLGWLLTCTLAFGGPQWGSLDDPPAPPQEPEVQVPEPAAEAPRPIAMSVQQPVPGLIVLSATVGGGTVDEAPPRPVVNPDPPAQRRPTPKAFAPGLALDAAEPLETMSRKQSRFLKPRRHRLPQDPYGQVDFTAYTLDPGELRLGLGSIRFGLLPRVHVGTAPVLDLLQIYNVHAKWNPIRLGPIDLAAVGAYWFTPQGNRFHGTYLQLGGQMSVRVTEGWTMHTSVRRHTAQAEGIPDPTPVVEFASRFIDIPFDTDLIPMALDHVEDPWATAEAWSFEVATDLRFNRRDAIVLRFGWVGYADIESDLGDIPPPPGFESHFTYKGPLPVSSSYVASISYQLSWKQLNVRIGAGQSSVPYAWVAQAGDISYSMGGQTNKSDARLKGKWRKNRKVIRKGESLEEAATEG